MGSQGGIRYEQRLFVSKNYFHQTDGLLKSRWEDICIFCSAGEADVKSSERVACPVPPCTAGIGCLSCAFGYFVLAEVFEQNMLKKMADFRVANFFVKGEIHIVVAGCHKNGG